VLLGGVATEEVRAPAPAKWFTISAEEMPALRKIACDN
jgi:hypothetical protein